MGLVDHHDVVVRDHRDALDRVDREQRVVGDDQLGLEGAFARPLREALVGEGAACRAQALPRGHRDLAPHPVGVAGCAVAVAGALGLDLLLHPLAQPDDLLTHAAARQRHVERALVVGHALAHAVEAGVVGPPLEHRVRRRLVQHVARSLDERRQVPLDQLVLQGQGRGGDHDPLGVQQGGHQVAQRLAGAGACLHQQVHLLVHRRGDLLGHAQLTRTLLPIEGCHRGREHLGDRRSLLRAHAVDVHGSLVEGGGVGHRDRLTPAPHNRPG